MLIGDVVDFSKAPAIDQRKIVETIWQFLTNHPTISGVSKASVNGTGDGALIAFDDIPFTDAIILALEWIDFMREQPTTSGLRVAIHTGKYQRIEVPGHDKQVAGIGPNECARLSSIGDGGDIVLSERFVEMWAEECGKMDSGVYRYLSPKFDPIELVVKHGVTQLIRLFSIEANRAPPKKIKRLDVIAQTLKEQVLRDIHDGFLLTLCEYDSELAALNTSKSSRRLISRISARVSILTEDPNRPGELSSNGYRYHESNSATVKGSVTYSIDPASPTGPAGHAFVRCTPVVANKLPDDWDNPNGRYAAKLLKDFGLNAEAISSMRRKPRSWVCFPFGLHLERMPPDGVVCIDCDDPLAGVSKKQLEEVADEISESYGLLVATLWNLRL